MRDRDWGEALRNAYNRWARENSKPTNNGITFPSGIKAESEEGGVRLTMSSVGNLRKDGTRKPPPVCQNMQTDSAAFESWALALKLWLGEDKHINKVTLRWDKPSPEITHSDGRYTKEGCHYERFLYRVSVFGRMFDWFEVAQESETLLRASRSVHSSRLWLNVPKLPRDAKAADGPLDELPENDLEKHLAQSISFKEKMRLAAFPARQLPVGLFDSLPISDSCRVFPGGGAAIDLLGTREDGRLVVFELKKGTNSGKKKKYQAGILSELLLYAALLREAAEGDDRISFAGTHDWSDTLKISTGVHGVMLAFQFHPLLMHPELISTLNCGARRAWIRKPVTFDQVYVESSW